MDFPPSNENARPWWADVAHLRDGHDPTSGPVTRTQAPAAPALVAASPDRERSARTRAAAVASRSRPARPARRGERTPVDWFEQEARRDGRRSTPRPDLSRPERPRATLVDVAPDHALLRRAPQVRRAPGERPTVTITGRPDAALPPQVQGPKALRARRTREHATAFVASPDRMILWAVALGLLMILASIGTASADAAMLLP